MLQKARIIKSKNHPERIGKTLWCLAEKTEMRAAYSFYREKRIPPVLRVRTPYFREESGRRILYEADKLEFIPEFTEQGKRPSWTQWLNGEE